MTVHPLLRLSRLARSPLGRIGSPAWGPSAATLVLIAVALVVRLGWNAAMETSNDESYHFLYTTHPALSYFDHPPMTMWVEAAGLMLCGGWVHAFSLRLGFALMFAGSTWVLYRWTARWFGGWAGFYAAFLLSVSGYYAAAGGFALPDGPFLFFGLLTMAAASEAVIAEPNRVRPWLWVGLAFGAAFLSKYHAIFLPAGVVLYAAVTPGARRLLWSPGPYLAVAIGFAMFSPVLVWNAQNGWASFVFQGGRAVGSGFKPAGLAAVLFGPIGYLLPWVWWFLVAAAATRLRRFRDVAGVERLMICLTVVPFLLFVAVGCVRWVLPHWPLIAFVPLFPLAGAAWAERAAIDPARSRVLLTRMAALILTFLGLAVAQGRFGVVKFPGKDPLNDASGWASVAAELDARGLVGQPNTFLFTTRWFDSGQLAFAVRDRSPVLNYNAADARGFAFWSTPDQWVGWDGLLVTTNKDDAEVDMLGHFFASKELVAEFPMTRGGRPFRDVRVWKFTRQSAGFPFTYPGQVR